MKHHGLRVTKIEQAMAKPLDFRTRVHTLEISDDENMGNPFRYSQPTPTGLETNLYARSFNLFDSTKQIV